MKDAVAITAVNFQRIILDGIVVLGVPGDTSLGPGQAWTAPRLEVSTPGPVHAGIDGEGVDLSPPLVFAIRPAALRVRISPRHPGASPSARLHPPGLAFPHRDQG